jgi:hypothetical protein
MLDYLFFDQGLARRFADQVVALGGQADISDTSGAGVQVRVPMVSLTEAAIAQLDGVYDELFFVEQAKLVEDQGGLADACGVQLQLSTGEFTHVLLNPEMMNRLLSVLSPMELQDLFNQVADAVENPQDHQCSVCHIMMTDA